MSNNPSRPTPMPVIPSGPAYGWIGRVNARAAELAKRDIPPECRRRLTKWANDEFVLGVLRIDAVSVAGSRDQSAAREATDRGRVLAPDRYRANLYAALQALRDEVSSHESQASVTADLLFSLYGLLEAGDGAPNEGPPNDPSTRPSTAVIDMTCQWWTADSFRELHPVEQAALVHLRLIDLNAFGKLTRPVSFLASSLLLLRAGLPPLIIPQAFINGYLNALDEGRRMNTRATVELFAEVTLRSLEELIRLSVAA